VQPPTSPSPASTCLRLARGLEGRSTLLSRAPQPCPVSDVSLGTDGDRRCSPLPHFVESEAPVQLRLDALYFSSAGGTVLNALKDGDVLFGPLWDGNLVIFDSDGATIVPSFFSPESAGVALVRTLPTPVAGSGRGRRCLPGHCLKHL